MVIYKPYYLSILPTYKTLLLSQFVREIDVYSPECAHSKTFFLQLNGIENNFGHQPIERQQIVLYEFSTVPAWVVIIFMTMCKVELQSVHSGPPGGQIFINKNIFNQKYKITKIFILLVLISFLTLIAKT